MAEDVEQAVGYAAHPEINAALVVHCDGWKIAVRRQEFCRLRRAVIRFEEGDAGAACGQRLRR